MIWSDMLFCNSNSGEYYTENPEIIGQEACGALHENVLPVFWDSHKSLISHKGYE